jgi:hypothetical protein
MVTAVAKDVSGLEVAKPKSPIFTRSSESKKILTG